MGTAYPGKLIVVEGVDGAGKSTQIDLLQNWLQGQGYLVNTIAWRSPAAIVDQSGKDKDEATSNPLSFSLLYAADFADKTAFEIVPTLKAGGIQLCDRYMYTAFARDVARGCKPKWVRQVYSFGLTPDLALYFKIPLKLALKRILDNRGRLGFYEAGMDQKISDDPKTSFGVFQQKIMDQYKKMVPEFGLTVVDASLDQQTLQMQIRAKVSPLLAGLKQEVA